MSDTRKHDAAVYLREGWVPRAVAEFTCLPLSTVHKIAAALKSAEVRAERCSIERILALHAEGKPVLAISALTRAPYRSVYDALYHRGLEPNTGPAVLPAPSVRPWTRADLNLALCIRKPDCPWIMLAQRLAFQYGETEALRRVNGYASERAAA